MYTSDAFSMLFRVDIRCSLELGLLYVPIFLLKEGKCLCLSDRELG